MTTERVVVVGADAGGMSAASQAKRLRPDLDVVVLERGGDTSYSACGIPYWIAGDVGSADDLVARTADEHRANGLDVRLWTEAVGVDLDRREVSVRDTGPAADPSASSRTSGEQRIGFDQLVLATGAEPVRPAIPGIGARGVHGVQTLPDGRAVVATLDGLARRRPSGAGGRHAAVVIGGGYIGVEMAEALLRHGLAVTVVDRSPEPMTTLDPEMGRLVRTAMTGMGIDVRTGVEVDEVEVGADGYVAGVRAGEERWPADVVVLGIGVRPATALARDAGLPLGVGGGLRTDQRMRVEGHDGVWAAGDCVQVFHRVSRSWTTVALGTHANKQGRVLGTNLGGGYATFPGVVGTAVSKVCDLEIGRTGLLEAEARAAGFAVRATTVESTTRAGYFPGAAPITVRLLAEERSGRLLGGQVVGRDESGKRVDTLAVALWNDMTVEEMTGLDLGYAPPFSPVWDPVLIAARKAAESMR